MQWRDHLAAQGLPAPHHHVDGAPAVEQGLEGLLLVLVDEVHVVDPQQPVIDPEEGHGQCPRRPQDPWAAPPLLSEGRVPGSRDPTYTFRKISPSRKVKWFNTQMLDLHCLGSNPGSTMD